jgi:hypothetical protein
MVGVQYLEAQLIRLFVISINYNYLNQKQERKQDDLYSENLV